MKTPTEVGVFVRTNKIAKFQKKTYNVFMNSKTFIFIGRSASGKGTQIKLLSKYFKEIDDKEYFHLESGNRFRAFIEEEKYTSKLAKEVSNNGRLQPEFLSIWVWSSELINNLNEEKNLFIDGTPRRLIEAKILDEALSFYNRNEVDVIYVNVSREWATESMKKRGRADDVHDTNKESRMDWFDKQVVPVIDYYRSHKNYKFHDINGEQSIEKVHEDIVNSIK
jgi:adenylate kinase family enzyme